MIDRVLQIVAPHHCFSCGKIGLVLCDNCKYNIKSEPIFVCAACARPTSDGFCTRCTLPYQKSFVVGWYDGVLKLLIDTYKFERMVEVHEVLASLLDTILPELPENTVIVPIPTISSHIRQRGYDHTMLIAKIVGKLRGAKVGAMLGRATNTSQRGASRKDRLLQAKTAFKVTKPIDENATYIIVDDVVTSGATVYEAAKLLRSAGAKHIWVAAAVRDPIDG